MIGLWKILTGEIPESSVDDEKHVIWAEKQEQLKALLSLILGTSPLSLIEKTPDKNATQQYQILKNEYNKISISTFAQLYRRIFRCSLSNHKSLREFGDEICDARNKLIELSRTVNELAVTCAFLDKLDSLFQK